MCTVKSLNFRNNNIHLFIKAITIQGEDADFIVLFFICKVSQCRNMKNDNIDPPYISELRRRAEERLKAGGLIPDSPTSTAEFQRILYELSVYQIELEMQKEQLQNSYDEIEKEKRRYADLYDFAPVGYLTLAPDSTILDVNLTATRILSLERSQLKGVRFGGLIAQRDLLAFNSMMKRAHLSREQEHSEVMIVSCESEKQGFPERTFRLDCIISENLQEYHLTLTDVTDSRVAVEELERKEERFRSMFESHSSIMLIIHPDSGFIIEANRAATRFYGWSVEELRAMRIEEIITRTPEQIEFFFEQCWTEDKNHLLYSHRRADKSIRDVEVYSSTIEISGETLLYTVVHDITEWLRHETATAFYISLLEVMDTMTIKQLLQKTLDKAELLTDSFIGFFHFVDEDQKMLTLQQWSTNTTNLLCQAKGERNHYSVDQAGVWADALRERKAVIHNDFASLPGRHGMPDGHATVIREVLVPIFRNEKVVAILGVGNKLNNYDEEDITWLAIIANAAWEVVDKKIGEGERIKLLSYQYRAEQLALHDSLTGLPNRRLLSERISLTMAQCRRNKCMAALMMFDLDKFKPVNDTFGHAIGDILLQQVAKRALETLRRSSDSISRLGGDEFVILLPQIEAISNAVAIAEKIRQKIKEPYTIEGHTINISCSIGIAVFPDHGEDELTLMKHADEAMYHAKNQGRDQVTVFETQSSQHATQQG